MIFRIVGAVVLAGCSREPPEPLSGHSPASTLVAASTAAAPPAAKVPATTTEPPAAPSAPGTVPDEQRAALDRYFKLGPTGRLERARATCQAGTYVEDAVLQAADDGEEVAALRAACDKWIAAARGKR